MVSIELTGAYTTVQLADGSEQQLEAQVLYSSTLLRHALCHTADDKPRMLLPQSMLQAWLQWLRIAPACSINIASVGT